ncbi:LysR family transcriptional regulator [Actinomadura syzygii]|uniref:LysR family transcriptional regulator n=1 Tax=Actinomadura syzygii TaxID=1427538 RepID=A0A5D0U7U4_9ACTN|nr:LysR family transcriptional regulator [Actinomadura syzygii]TYC14408.1 LysR family transcriptional regulator [Actinomadura syzygii]
MSKGEADLDLAAVRAFVAITEDRYFSEAAARLGISQQAISKRIAKLESVLGVPLFARSRGGADLTDDGAAFLPHARVLVGTADQALELLRNRRRALRVDVLDTRVAPIDLVRAFHGTVPDVDIEIITSDGLRSARDALARGSVDAAFCRVGGTPGEDLVCLPAHLEPAHLLVGRDHPFAGLRQVEIARLAGFTVWMPGNAAGSEWAEYHELLSAEFGFRIDTTGPNFGYEHFVAEVASGERATSIVGEDVRIPWHPDTVRIPLVDPVPLYPWSMLYHRRNHHPALALLAHHITRNYRPFDPRHKWLPATDRAAFTAVQGARR